VFALILYSMIVSFLIGLACYTLFAIGNLLGALFFGYAWHPVTIVVLGAELTGGALVGFILWNEKRKERDRDNPKEPGFVGLAYRSWKDKFCAKVEFK
jgi:Na+/proline symporter